MYINKGGLNSRRWVGRSPLLQDRSTDKHQPSSMFVVVVMSVNILLFLFSSFADSQGSSGVREPELVDDSGIKRT